MALLARVHADHPQRFGSYELLEQLGQGGMAVVYRACSHAKDAPRREVVLKAMLPNLCSSKALVDMFESEARLTAQLRHPNIVEVSDYGIADGVPYLIMEYLDGRNLSQVRNALNKLKRRTPVGIAITIVRDLCLALGYAHHFVDSTGKRMQVIHRDVSPSNVMVQRDGSVKLLDFGVAKLSSAGGREITASLKGKFAYMAPEQVNHEPIDRRCDVFAAGIVLHELFVGRRLFGTKSELETLRRVSSAEAAPPSRSNPEVPPEVDAIVMRALSRHPQDRYASGQEMAVALDKTGLLADRRALAALIEQLVPRPVAAARPAGRRSQTADDAETEIAASPAIEESTAPGGGVLRTAPDLLVLPNDDAILDDVPLDRLEITPGDMPSSKVQVDARGLWGDATAPARPSALVVVVDDTRPNELGEATDPHARRAAPDTGLMAGRTSSTDPGLGEAGPTRIYDPSKATAARPEDRDFEQGGATHVYAAPRHVEGVVARPTAASTRPPASSTRLDPRVIFEEASTDPAAPAKPAGTEHVDLPSFVPAPAARATRQPRRMLWPAAISMVLIAAGLILVFARPRAGVPGPASSAAPAVHRADDAPVARPPVPPPSRPSSGSPPPSAAPPAREEPVSLVGLAQQQPAEGARRPGSADPTPDPTPKPTRERPLRASPPRPQARPSRPPQKRPAAPKQSVKEGRIVDPFDAAE